MKQKAETYKKKRIVMGDENLVTNSEIHIKDVVKDLYGDVPSGGGGTSQMEYWSFPNGLTKEAYESELVQFCSVFKAVGDGNTVVWPAALLTILGTDYEMCVGLAFDRNLKITVPGEGMVTIGEYMDAVGFDVTSFGGILVTEEEFYTS